MAIVKGIMALIHTSDVDGAGTDGGVVLGIGGREFRIDSSADDFKRNSRAAYIFGDVTEDTAPYVRRTVSNPQYNDPRSPMHLYSENLDLTPVYLRWEYGGNSPDWSIEDAAVWAFTETTSTGYFPPSAPSGLWLGDRMGTVLRFPLKLVISGRVSMCFDEAVRRLRAQLTPVAAVG